MNKYAWRYPARAPEDACKNDDLGHGKTLDCADADSFLTGDVWLAALGAKDAIECSIDLGDGNRRKSGPRYDE